MSLRLTKPHLSVKLHRRLSFKLVSRQIGVVTRGDVVMGQGLVHQVLVQGVRVQRGVVAVHEEAGETLEAEQTV